MLHFVPKLVRFGYYFIITFTARSLSHITAMSSAERSCTRPSSSSLVSGLDCIMWFIICGCPLEHLSDDAIHHLCRLAAHWSFPVWKWFVIDNKCQGRSKPCAWIVGSDIKLWLTTEVNHQPSHHSVFILTVVLTHYAGSLFPNDLDLDFDLWSHHLNITVYVTLAKWNL